MTLTSILLSYTFMVIDLHTFAFPNVTFTSFGHKRKQINHNIGYLLLCAASNYFDVCLFFYTDQQVMVPRSLFLSAVCLEVSLVSCWCLVYCYSCFKDQIESRIALVSSTQCLSGCKLRIFNNFCVVFLFCRCG